MSFPDNITRAHILKAIVKIEDEGVPAGAHSSTYDVAYKDGLYPPKLVVSYANLFANGKVLKRSGFHGGRNEPAFRLLKKSGFEIYEKEQKYMTELDAEEFEYFSEEEFKLLEARMGQAWDKNDPDKVADKVILKKAYDKTDYWMNQVAKKAFGVAQTRINRSVTNQAQKFESYNWGKIYPSLIEKEVGELAYTVGMQSDGIFRIKIDTVGNCPGRQDYLNYRDANEISLSIPMEEGLSLGWNKLIERSADFIAKVMPHYNVIKELLKGDDKASLVSEDSTEYKLNIKHKDSQAEPLNRILYGPPGTGKTYRTINEALAILEPELNVDSIDRAELKAKFDGYKKSGRIHFVTFHQSFSYEDFVEGLRAYSNDGAISYSVDPGVFKKGFESLDEQLDQFIEDVAESPKQVTTITGKTFTVRYNGGDTFLCDPMGAKGDRFSANIQKVKQLLSGVEPEKMYCASYVRGIAQHIKGLSPARDVGFSVGQKFGDYEVVNVTDEILSIRKPNGLVLPYPVTILNELKEHVLAGSITLQDIRDKVWVDKVSTEIETYLVNGYNNLIPKIVEFTLINNIEEDRDGYAPPVVLIIDEINRGNISSIFGELITLIEPSKREGASEALSVILPYSKESFSVPANLHIIGTMNTADRSLALMDTALRRRFEFVAMMPDTKLLSSVDVQGINIQKMLDKMNQRIEVLYDREHTLGHAFFMPLIETDENKRFGMLQGIFKNKILPLLEEYFFEDWEKIRLVLGDNQKKDQDLAFIIKQKGNSAEDLFGNTEDLYEAGIDETRVYKRNDRALKEETAYRGIYGQ